MSNTLPHASSPLNSDLLPAWASMIESGDIEGWKENSLHYSYVPYSFKGKKGRISRLHAAVLHDQVEMARFFIEQDPLCIYEQDNLRNTCLFYAVGLGNVEMVLLLLQNGLTPSAKHIIEAISQNRYEVANVLFSLEGVKIKVQSSYLKAVAQTGNMNMAKLLLEKGITICDITASIVSMAAENSHWDLVEIFLAEGAGMDEKTFSLLQMSGTLVNRTKNWRGTEKFGKIGIKMAAENGSFQLARACLERGANIENIINEDNSIISVGLKNHHFALVHFLLSQSNSFPVPPLHGVDLIHACQNEIIDEVKKILSHTVAPKEYEEEELANYQTTSLHLACKTGNLSIVEIIIQNHSFINTKDSRGYTCLHVASKSGHLEIVRFLIINGADFMAENNHSKSCLYAAAKMGYVSICELLLSKGCDPFLVDNGGHSIIQVACENHHWKVVRLLIAHGVKCEGKYLIQSGSLSLFKKCIPEGSKLSKNTKKKLVNCAIKLGRLEILDYLFRSKLVEPAFLYDTLVIKNPHILKCFIENGADINKPDIAGKTILQQAVKLGHLDVVIYLIQHGADVLYIDSNMNTILDYAIMGFSVEIMHYLLFVDGRAKKLLEFKGPAETPCIFLALKKRQTEMVFLLVQAGASLAWKEDQTIFDLAITYSPINLEIAEVIATAMVDEEKKNRARLIRSIYYGHLEIVRDILSKGLIAEDPKTFFMLPLFLAVERNFPRIVQLLLEYGSDVHAKKREETVLQVAAKLKNNLQICKCLVEYGASIDEKHYFMKVSSLELSLRYSDVDVSIYFIEQGAELNDNMLYYPVQRGTLELVKLLVSKGVSVNGECNGECFLFAAAKCGRFDIIEFLLENDVAAIPPASYELLISRIGISNLQLKSYQIKERVKRLINIGALFPDGNFAAVTGTYKEFIEQIVTEMQQIKSVKRAR